MTTAYKPLASLPYLCMEGAHIVKMGPIRFCSGANLKKEAQFIPEALQEILGNDLQHSTFAQISSEVPEELHQNLLGDAVCLLFFLFNFRQLVCNGVAPRLDLFTSIIPINALLEDGQSKVHYDPTSSKVLLNEYEETLAEALGHTLRDAYGLGKLHGSETDPAMRIARAIRFFVERFYPQLNDLSWHGLLDQSSLWESEAAVYLALSWESLLNIDKRHPEADLKHKLRPMLQLKYAAPVEVLWKWVDGFFTIRSEVVHGQKIGEGAFTGNPSMTLSHVFLGFKVFVYCVHYELKKLGYLTAIEEFGPDQPVDFQGIRCEELLVFFWSEQALLFRIRKALKSLQKKIDHQELRGDIKLMTRLYVYLAKTYLLSKPEHIEVHRDSQDAIEEIVYQVLHAVEAPETTSANDAQPLEYSQVVQKLLDPDFISCLRKRLYPF